MKKTDTWALRFTAPTQTSYLKQLSAITYDVHSGETRTLLKDGRTINRLPLKDKDGNDVELVMPIPIMGEVYLKESDRSGRTVQNRYMQQLYEVPKNGMKEGDFNKDDWAMYQRNKAIVEYAKSHIAVSWKNTKGEEQNRNVSKTSKPSYILINMDAAQDEQAEFEIKKNQLLAQLISAKEDPEEFMNLAYGMNVNPAGMNINEVFNLLCKLVDKNPNGFEKFMNDEDRRYRIVISKAQRMKTNSNEPFIIKDNADNYVMNGIAVANGEFALIAYFKEHSDSFETLESNLGMKKKMTSPKSKAA